MTRLNDTMTYRDLCRSYVGQDATDAECDWLFMFVGGWPVPVNDPRACEVRIASWCREAPEPLERIRAARRTLADGATRSERMGQRRLADLRELVGLPMTAAVRHALAEAGEER